MTRDDVLDFIQREEGGVADVGDGKGTTHFGQTEAWLTEWGFAVPNTPGQARGNWKKWTEAIGLDAIVDAHPKLGLAVFDYATGPLEKKLSERFSDEKRWTLSYLSTPDSARMALAFLALCHSPRPCRPEQKDI